MAIYCKICFSLQVGQFASLLLRDTRADDTPEQFIPNAPYTTTGPTLHIQWASGFATATGPGFEVSFSSEFAGLIVGGSISKELSFVGEI